MSGGKLPLNSSFPAQSAAAITPSDSVSLSPACRGIWVGTGGNIAVVMNDGTTATFINVGTGYLLPIAVQRVNATNTTASNLLALY